MKVKCYANFSSNITGNYVPSFLLVKEYDEKDEYIEKESEQKEIKEGHYFPDFRDFLR